jgi:hypothetical protein
LRPQSRELGVGSWKLIAALCVVGALTAACGKKGPPLTPIVRVPAAVEGLTARRMGGDVYVTLTIPRQNIDGSSPASVARVELYGATSYTTPTRARFLEIAALVGTVPVLPAADPANPGVVMPAPDPKAGAPQGTAVTLRDVLTPAAMTPRELTVLNEGRRPQTTTATVAPPRVLRRFYMAVAFSNRGQSGPYSTVVEMPLTGLPDRPTGLRASLTMSDLWLEWEPAGGLLGWLMSRALPMETAPFVESAAARSVAPVTADLPAGPTQYNVYREVAADPLVLPDIKTAVMPWNTPAPQPANPTPLATLLYTDPIAFDERTRCYTVRSVVGIGAQRIESEPSERGCITPIDVDPPLAPTNLDTVVAEGVINLIWEPNGEEDLGGYIVLRAEPGSDTLLQLTAAPISVTRFSDRNVTAGVRYTYIVRAVDSRVPLPNQSAPAEASATAR